tara:strand:- start:286 stop:729 length:444 start_codon:yes stop_codon:yes gene_type:complete
MDNLNKERRSWNMSRIKSKNTKPEILVKKYLYHNGVKFRSSKLKMIGNPDIIIKKYKLALFVHGCFWHGHNNCKYFRYPKSNVEFWKKKINANIDRDKKVSEKLSNLSYQIFVIWECEIKQKNYKKLDNFVLNYFELKNQFNNCEIK